MATNNAINVSFPIAVTQGGIGSSTLTNHGVLVGATTSVTALSVGSDATLLVGASAADPAFATSATGDFTFTSTTAGATRTLTISNTDNTDAASIALRQVTVGGASAGDPKSVHTVSGVTNFSEGIDNSDSDKFKISASTALGTSDRFVMTVGGQNTMPSNSCVTKNLQTQDNNVTGDGTVYTYGSGNALTNLFDQNGNMSSVGVFTAPVTGIYAFCGGINCVDAASNTSTTNLIQIATTARTYKGMDTGITYPVDFLVVTLANMTAGDTATLQFIGSGTTKTVDIYGFGPAGAIDFYSAFLAC